MGKIKALWNKFKQQLTTGNKWILWCVVGSILAMLVIHALFVPVGPDWLQARWGAGDLLTYVGTVSLSLLAVWQNKRFKEENDKAQERLERISQQANELAIINKILEHEEHRIERMNVALSRFDDFSDLTRLLAQQRNLLKEHNVTAGMVQCRLDLQNSYKDLLFQLVDDPFIDTNALRVHATKCFLQAGTVVDMISHSEGMVNPQRFSTECDKLKQLKLDFLEMSNNYLDSVNKTYRHLLYDNVSIQEIRAMRVNQIQEDAEGQCKEQQSEKI